MSDAHFTRVGDELWVGRWRIVRPLARGGFGTSYLGRDRAGEEAAIKRLVEPPGDEVRALGLVVHEAVPALLGAGGFPWPYIAMERCRGETLTERLRRGTLPVDDAVAVFVRLADALATCHRAGVCHGDVKPDNVLIDGSVASLVDFGMAGRAAGGTATYAAPERFQGRGQPASDIYSLGVVIYTALHGDPPALSDRLSAGVPMATSAPAWLAQVLARVLDPEPAARPSAEVLVDELTRRGARAPGVSSSLLLRRARRLRVEREHHRAVSRWLVGGGALAVVGPPGSGRTHTVDWAEEQLIAGGAPVVRVVGCGRPWGGIERMYRDPALGARASEAPAHPDATTRVMRYAEALAPRLRGFRVLVDADGLDPHSAEVLRQLAVVDGVPVLWVGDAPAWITRTTPILPWTVDDLVALVADLLASPRAPLGAELLAVEARGAPGALVEAVVAAHDAGALERVGRSWLVVDERLKEFLERGLRRDHGLGLSASALRLGAAVAAWGAPVSVAEASAWAGLDGDTGLAAAHELIHARWAVAVDPDALTIDVPSATARAALRADPQLRVLVDRVMRRIDPEQAPARWLALALAVEDPEPLLGQVLDAARRLLLVDSAEAARWLRRLVEHQRFGSLPGLPALWVRALVRSGDLPAARQAGRSLPSEELEALAELAMMEVEAQQFAEAEAWLSGEPVLAPAVWTLARAHVAGARRDLTQAMALASQVVETEAPESAAFAEASIIRAKCFRGNGRLDDAQRVLEHVPQPRPDRVFIELSTCMMDRGLFRASAALLVDLAARSKSLSYVDLATVRAKAGAAWHRAGDLERAIEQYTLASRAFERRAMHPQLVLVLNNMVEAYREIGRYNGGREAGVRALGIARAGAMVRVQYSVLGNLTDLEIAERNLDDAERYLAEAQALAPQVLAEGKGDPEQAVRQATLAVLRERPDAVLVTEYALRCAVDAGDVESSARARVLLATCEAALGQHHKIPELLHDATAELERRGHGRCLAEVRTGFSEVFATIGRVDEAQQLATLAQAWADEFNRDPLKVRVDRVLAGIHRDRKAALSADASTARMVELSIAILYEQRAERIIQAIASAARELTGADRCFVIEAGAPPTLLGSDGANPDDGPSWSLVERCLLLRRDVLVRDLRERDDLNRSSSVQALHLQAVLVVPFDVRGHLRGVIYVDRQGESFDRLQSLAGLLRALASYAGVALSNAELIQENVDRVLEARMLAHDLVNPLAVCRSTAEELLHTRADAVARDLHAGASTALDMVQGFLHDAVRDRDSFELVTAMSQWIRPLVWLVRSRGVRIELNVDDDARGILVLGDRVELGRAVTNLLSNAVKYAPDGSVVLVRAQAIDGAAVLTVSDEGSGVPEGFESRIFETNVQAPGAKAGLGLGLPIARRVAREHGGDLVLLPSARGASFAMRLPLHAGR